MHHDSHSKGWLVVKKLLSLLIALSVFAGSAALIGCGDDKKDKEKKADSSKKEDGKKADGK